MEEQVDRKTYYVDVGKMRRKKAEETVKKYMEDIKKRLSLESEETK